MTVEIDTGRQRVLTREDVIGFPTLTRRFWSYVAKGEPGECWLWVGARTSRGYGTIRAGRYGSPMVLAHRLAFVLENGEIPDGLTVDHLCRVRACVNARHMEAVTRVENVMRGESGAARNARRTACANGHPYDATRITGGRSYRACRQCHAAYVRDRRAAGLAR